MINHGAWILTALITLLLVGCSTGSADETVEELDPPTAVPGTSWITTSYDDGAGKLVDVLDGTEITANFSRETPVAGQLTGFAGCNEYSAEYDVAGEYLGIGTSRGTVSQRVCTEPQGVMEQEEAYLTALANVIKWVLDDYELKLTGSGEVVILTYRYVGPFEDSEEEEEFVMPPDGVEFSYNFDDYEEGWIAGFADLPVDYDPAIYELDHEWRQLPDDLDGFGIYMQGHNRSDDLFMYLKRELDGLDPGVTYEATFKLDIASDVPEGLAGVGGSPGESVYFKAGATTIEPLNVEDDQDWWRMNIDKGNQANGGEDMIVVGDMANPNLTPDTVGQYELMTVDSNGREFEVTADDNGIVWFIVGTDSGFEGLTTLYYDAITVVLAQK
jgi:heat shock protein HslJ